MILPLSALSLFGQTVEKKKKFEIYFEHDKYDIKPEYHDNDLSIQHFSDFLDSLERDSLRTIKTIKVNSFTSPEGGVAYNDKLSINRTQSIYNYLITTISVPGYLIETAHSGIAWELFREIVEASDMEYRDEVLDIIDNQPEETWKRVNPGDRWLTLVDSRNKRIMDLRGGRVYNYMFKELYPTLRYGSVISVYYEETIPEVLVAPEPEPSETLEAIDSVVQDTLPEILPIEPLYDEKSLRFAVKTNLLSDVLAAPNIELEILIKERWSIAAEWVCPWWVGSDNGKALQNLAGSLELKYWLGDRTNKPQLTGWFAGFYVAGGYYDFQKQNNGYQGEFYIPAALSGGYAHTINKSGSLRMEYSIGVGYMFTDYRYYEGKEDNEYLVWQYNGEMSWFGPTKLKVSLEWFIDWKLGKYKVE